MLMCLAYKTAQLPLQLHIFVQVQVGDAMPTHMYIHQGSFTKALHKSLREYPYNPGITLEVFTWQRDNQGLYDYQCPNQQLDLERIFIKQSGKIYRQANSIKAIFIPEDRDTYFQMNNIFVASVLYDDVTKQYRIQSAETSGVCPYPFMAQGMQEYRSNSYLSIADYCKSNKQQGYPLEVGSFIRLGKVSLQVIEINDESGIKQMRETSHLDTNRGVYIIQPQVTVKGSCRVCLCEENTASDPLITPCMCSGSCGLIHMDCLRQWINKKVKRQTNNNAVSYNFSRFQCQICKQLFPKTIILANKTEVTLLDYLKVNRPYIILESRTHSKSTHILFPTQTNPVKLGRSHNCNVRIDDITVSRSHAEMYLFRGQFYIKDLRSKFGTLVKFKDQFVLKDTLRLQSGRSTFTFSYQPSGNILSHHPTPKKSSQSFRKETSQHKIERYK